MPGNLYRRGDIWWGRVQCAGRDHRRSLRTRHRAEAQRRFDRWKDELTAATHFGERRLSWEAAVLRYAAEVMPGAVKASTAARYLVSFRQVDPLLAGQYLDRIDRRVLADLISARRKAGASNATINRDLTAVSAVLGAAVEWGDIERNVALDIERRRVTKERREPIRPPADAEVARVVAKAPKNFAALIRFLALTGCRQEEGASLEWPQVDLARGEALLLKTKTSRPRRIALGREAVALLQALPRTLAGKHVFWHGAGERYANVASRFAAIVRSAQKQAQSEGADFRPFRCHDLRHAYAIEALDSGRDIYDLSRHLGHSSVKTTELYLGFVRREEPARNPAHVQRFAD